MDTIRILSILSILSTVQEPEKVMNDLFPGGTPPPRLLLTRREAAKALGISERMVWQLTAAGQLIAIRLPGRGARARAIRYSADDLRDWIARLKAGPNPAS